MSLVKKIADKQERIAIVGLGYVGLPLAVEFGKRVKTIGFDVNKKRISELKHGCDHTGEVDRTGLKEAKFLEFTTDPKQLRRAKFIIVAVPTPITKNKMPDLQFVISASEVTGKHLTKGSIVVFESTVYPGVTEDVCVPILEKYSKLKFNHDFKVGYSPERINPGDKAHTVANVVKIVSGCDKETLKIVAGVYSLVVRAGVHEAESIKCAEAAKVIENTQRDLNIAFMNELAMIFNKMDIDTRSVLAAAGTKWNFIKMEPGLVGGHCIGVDPYYLTFKAEEIGHEPQIILAGRRINDGMGQYIAAQTLKLLIDSGKAIKDARVLVLGMTFKENVRDIRNSRVIDIINELKKFKVKVLICDPLADPQEVKKEYGVTLTKYTPNLKADAVIIAVAHDVFKKTLNIHALKTHLSGNRHAGVIVDVKGFFTPHSFAGSGLLYWRL